MVCIYCGSKTTVTNSRPQKRLMQTWRRRQCTACNAIFSTNELVDLASSLVVRHDSLIQPFTRDKLFLSLYKALGHRQDAVHDASALTATITAQICKKTTTGLVEHSEIAKVTHQVLVRFDKAGAVQYAAYHKVR